MIDGADVIGSDFEGPRFCVGPGISPSPNLKFGAAEGNLASALVDDLNLVRALPMK